MEPQNQFIFGDDFTADDWLEAVDLYSPAQLSIGRQRAVSTLTGYVEDFTKLKACVHYLRGYSYVDENKNLRRVLPARHPIWKNLVCTEILECQGMQFDQKQDVSEDNPDLPFASYKKFKVVASFDAPPYSMEQDELIVTEDDRFTTFDPHPYVDNYVVQGGEVLYVATGKDWNNRPIPYPISIRSTKSLYELKWHGVPRDFICDGSTGAYPNFDRAIGKISSDTYAGKEPGCWLVEQPEFTPYNDPVVGDLFGNLGRFVDVTIKLRLWEPEVGYDDGTSRGWLLVLASDGKGYPVKRQTGTKPLFDSVAISSLFTHWT